MIYTQVMVDYNNQNKNAFQQDAYRQLVVRIWGGVPGPGGCTWSRGGVPGPGGYLVGGCTWSWGVYLVPGGCTWSGGVPGGCNWSRGCTWSRGVYLVPGGCTWSGGVPGGCTWSRGVPGLGGVPGRGGLPGTPPWDLTRYSPPVDRLTLVKILPWPNFVEAGNKCGPQLTKYFIKV